MAGSRVRALRERLRERNPFPEGSATIGLWLIVAGVTAYLFLAISGRALGSNRYSALAVLWVLAFTAAPGFFQPLEQEIARAVAARRARRAAIARAISCSSGWKKPGAAVNAMTHSTASALYFSLPRT